METFFYVLLLLLDELFPGDKVAPVMDYDDFFSSALAFLGVLHFDYSVDLYLFILIHLTYNTDYDVALLKEELLEEYLPNLGRNKLLRFLLVYLFDFFLSLIF